MNSAGLSKNEIAGKVKTIVASIVDIDVAEIDLPAKLINDLGADSIDLLTLASKIQKEFGVKFSIKNLVDETTGVFNETDTIHNDNVIHTLENVLSSKLSEAEKLFIEELFNRNNTIAPNDVGKIVAELLTIERITDQIFRLLIQDGKQAPNE